MKPKSAADGLRSVRPVIADTLSIEIGNHFPNAAGHLHGGKTGENLVVTDRSLVI